MAKGRSKSIARQPGAHRQSTPYPAYIAPTLLDGIPDTAKIVSEEIFGPLPPIISYEQLDRFSHERAVARNRIMLAKMFYGFDALADRLVHQDRLDLVSSFAANAPLLLAFAAD